MEGETFGSARGFNLSGSMLSGEGLGPLGEVEPALDALDVEGDGVGVRGTRRPSMACA